MMSTVYRVASTLGYGEMWYVSASDELKVRLFCETALKNAAQKHFEEQRDSAVSSLFFRWRDDDNTYQVATPDMVTMGGRWLEYLGKCRYMPIDVIDLDTDGE